MQNKGSTTISIGVIAHNDAANIIYLLRSILKQRGSNFSIDEIVVISDGSSDNTVEKVKKYSEKNPIIKVFNGSKKRGKIVRIHQLFSVLKSEFIFIFDGNGILFKNNVLEKMTSYTNSSQISLICPHIAPLPTKGLTANMIKRWNLLTDKIKTRFNNGENIYNFNGSAFGIRSSLAKNLVFHNAIGLISPYLYLVTKSHNLAFKYVKNTTILFPTPSTYSEYLANLHSARSEKKKIISIFGKEIKKEFSVPPFIIFRTFVLSILKNPLNVFVIFIFAFLRLLPGKNSTFESHDNWTIAASRRKAHSY